MKDPEGETIFIIRDSDLDFIAAGGCYLFDTSVLEAELTAAWTGIRYASRFLRCDHHILRETLLVSLLR